MLGCLCVWLNTHVFVTLAFECSGDYLNDGYSHRVHGDTYRKHCHSAADLMDPPTIDTMMANDRDEQKNVEQRQQQVALDSELLNWNGWNELPSQQHHTLPTTNAVFTRSSSQGFTVAPVHHDSLSLHPDSDASHALRASGDNGDDPTSIPDYGLDLDEESALLHSKLESIATFYNELLNDTLRKQYEYFTGRAHEMHEEDERQRSEVEPRMSAEIEQVNHESNELSEALSNLDQRNKVLERSIREVTQKVGRLNEENTFVKELNRNLLADQMARKKAQAATTHNMQAGNSIPPEQRATAAAATPATPTQTPLVRASSTPSTPAAPSTLTETAAPASISSSVSSSSSSSSPSSSGSGSVVSSVDPALVSKYAKLREDKSRRIAALEKEVARAMEEMEQRTKKEQAAQQQAEAARRQRINKAESARGRRG